MRLCRVEMAQRLLRQTSRPLVAIAGECGFADQSHMTKAFRLAVGVSPA
ncbi:MAG: helix-turn-helix domain-containing protein, partial [Gemmataceae bacterium]|nr:helix-turn-helix domain-containing protein [Gemmataceae bacterium]